MLVCVRRKVEVEEAADFWDLLGFELGGHLCYSLLAG